MRKKKIGIGIPTANRPLYLKTLLKSLGKQRLDGGLSSVKIVVVEDSLPEGIPSIETEYDYDEPASPAELVIVKGPRKGPHHCHQRILEHFSEDQEVDLIVRLDDDVEPLRENFIQLLVDLIKSDDKILGVGGIFVQPGIQNRLQACRGWDYHCQMRWNLAEAPFEVPHLHSSYIYRKKAALDVGGFPLYYSSVGHREETDFSLRLKFLAKGKLFVHPEAVACHHRAPFGGIRKSNYAELAREDDLLFKKKMSELGIRIDSWDGKPMFLG